MKICYIAYIIIISSMIPYIAISQDYEHSANHHFSVFAGANSGLNENGETAATLGAQYELVFRNTEPDLGIGLFFEAALYDKTEMILGLPLFIHAYKGLKFHFAPCILMTNEDNELQDNDNETDFGLNENTVTSDNEFYIRIGAAYDFYFNTFNISPSVSLDQIGSHSFLVYGINFGITF